MEKVKLSGLLLILIILLLLLGYGQGYAGDSIMNASSDSVTGYGYADWR